MKKHQTKSGRSLVKKLATSPLITGSGVIVMALMTIGCGLFAQGPAAIDQVYSTFSEAYRQLDADMIEALYENDAFYLYPQIPLQRGHENFMNGFRDMFRRAKADSTSLAIQFEIVERELLSTHAYDVGYYKLTRSNGKQSVGKFVTILKKQSDGSWKFVLDSYSSAPLDSFEKE